MQFEQMVKAPGREAQGEASSRDEEAERASPRRAGAVAARPSHPWTAWPLGFPLLAAAFVVAHGSGYFPDVQAETAYTAWLGLHADRVVRRPHFDVFMVSGVATMKPSGEPLPARRPLEGP